MTHRQVLSLRDETYEVMIDSTLDDGYLTYGEYLKKGESDEEVLLSAHICHPSLANDNCSGIALLTYLASRLSTIKTRYSYRFLFAPGTIGSIAWLALNERTVKRIKHGLVLSMVGDGGGPTYKKSRQSDAKIDRAVSHVLRHSGLKPSILDFSPYGYDERQSARLPSICRWACFNAASSARSRNIIPLPTTWILSGQNIWRSLTV